MPVDSLPSVAEVILFNNIGYAARRVSSQSEVTHMIKSVSTSKKTRKQHSPEFRSEVLKLAERIGVAAAARELSLYESLLYNWRSKQQRQQTSSESELEMSTEIARLKRQLAERDEERPVLQKSRHTSRSA